MILVARPHIVHVVIYLLEMGITGTKKSENHVRIRLTVCAAGVWHNPHTAKIRTSKYPLRLIPKMIGIAPPWPVAPCSRAPHALRGSRVRPCDRRRELVQVVEPIVTPAGGVDIGPVDGRSRVATGLRRLAQSNKEDW